MKLLLTSAGITNRSLAAALKRLVRGEMKIAFIPTSADIGGGSKDWLIKNYNECERLGTVDIVDISAVGRREWLPRLEWANVIVMGGGGRGIAHLMRWIRKSGLEMELPRLLRSRVYVGISAGSIVVSKRLSASSNILYGRKAATAQRGLGYVDFYVRPHLNKRYGKGQSPHTDRSIREHLDRIDGDLYAIDDNTGILFLDGKAVVISEGKWRRYARLNKKAALGNMRTRIKRLKPVLDRISNEEAIEAIKSDR